MRYTSNNHVIETLVGSYLDGRYSDHPQARYAPPLPQACLGEFYMDASPNHIRRSGLKEPYEAVGLDEMIDSVIMQQMNRLPDPHHRVDLMKYYFYLAGEGICKAKGYKEELTLRNRKEHEYMAYLDALKYMAAANRRDVGVANRDVIDISVSHIREHYLPQDIYQAADIKMEPPIQAKPRKQNAWEKPGWKPRYSKLG